ncbi:MAG: uroporphyrinogen decarboxylase family protein [Thermoproteota archaeon]
MIINEPVIESLLPGKSYVDFVEWAELDGITVFEDQKFEKNGEYLMDEWGIKWKTISAGVNYPVKGPLREKRDLEEYSPPDPDASWRLKTLEYYVDRFKGEKAIVFLGHEAFEFSHYLVGGLESLFLHYYRNKDFVHRLSEIISQYKCRVIERAVKIGADVVLTGDDYANRKGPLMSVKQFEEFVLPYLKKAIQTAKKLGAPFIKHTDGNLLPVLDMIVNSGIDALDPIEPIAGMDIGEIKEKYGRRIAVIGNVDCSYVLPLGSEMEVEEAVKETIAKASPGGGHIMASSNSIHPAVKPSNYLLMVKLTKKYGQYPIDRNLIEEYGNKKYIAKYLT